MSKRLRLSGILSLAALVALSGCAALSGVRTTPSSGVDRIPTTIAMHPLLSNTKPDVVYRPIMPRANASNDEVYLAPPAESELAVTPTSQMLTGELSAQMTGLGFDLRELPYEMKESYGPDGGNAYVISLALLDQLREQYGLEAVLVGNAFFSRTGGLHPGEIDVVAAYLKVIDTETLEVLCQVTMSYDAQGREMNGLAKSLASELARMAGLKE